MNYNRTTQKKTLVAAIIIASCTSGILYWLSTQCNKSDAVTISAFDDTRDTKDVLQLFKDNWSLLISSPDYSPAYALKYRTPNRNPRYLGSLQIKILHTHKKFAGFVAYYFKNSADGFILFLGVKDEFRRKGYGRALIQYAINDLINQGAKTIRLLTRTSNTKAQALYKSLNFAVESIDPEGFVNFYYAPTEEHGSPLA